MPEFVEKLFEVQGFNNEQSSKVQCKAKICGCKSDNTFGKSRCQNQQRGLIEFKDRYYLLTIPLRNL